VVPGSAKRIITLVETETAHRQALEKLSVTGDIYEARLGQIFGFLIGLFAIGCGTYAAVHGAEVAGTVIGSGGVIGLVTAFIYGRKKIPNA
jgi:uncharacterized membrane protein